MMAESTTTPQLLATGSIEELSTPALAAEGMVVCQFRPMAIVNAVIILLANFYAFNTAYPKGQCKNIFVLLDHLLLGKQDSSLPIAVEHFMSGL